MKGFRMPLNIPTTEEIKDRNLANLEASINQTSPLNNKAFLRVLSALEALNHTEQYKLVVERTKQNLAITATGIDLDLIGAEYGIVRKPAEAAILTITIPGTNGTTIPATIDYVGDSNNIRYSPESSVIVAGGLGTSNVTAQTLGTIGNLNVSDTLTIGTQVAGITTTATVTVVVNIGAETETDDVYRARVLNAIRTTTGGGNAADYKEWGEEVAGVKQVFPYAGTPESPLPGIDTSSVPGERTLFVEADVSVDPDGIAPTALKDEVRVSVTTDPVTGAERPPLGLIDSTLFVETITRTETFVEITGFDAGTGVEVDIKAEIETALTTYFLAVKMFVVAIDLPADRNDLITEGTIWAVVQSVLSAGDASATAVTFGVDTGVPVPLTSLQLEPGELMKLGAVGGVTYA